MALATPVGRSGVATIRISGKDAHLQLDKIFEGKSELKPAKMCFGKVVCKEFCDRVLAVKFFAPNSFTGEHVCEIHCHGSPVVYSGIIQELLDNGCTMAERGEFTRRALLNGKLDLLQAEGVYDIVQADTVAQVVQSNMLLDGALSLKVNELQAQLLSCLAGIEVALDYPEEDLELDTKQQLRQKLSCLSEETSLMLTDYQQSRLIRDGVKVVLVGEPNVGKSSLFNALLGFERAIVDSIAGTTRDVIQDSYVYNAVKFVLSDVAGLREAIDNIEKQGVQRAKIQVQDADVLLCLDHHFESDDRAVLIDNKADLDTTKLHDNRLPVSAMTGFNIDKLKLKVYNKIIHLPKNSVTINNLRQYNALRQAHDSIELALRALHTTTLDCIAVDVRKAWESVRSLTGQAIVEEVLDTIFSQFCVGK